MFLAHGMEILPDYELLSALIFTVVVGYTVAVLIGAFQMMLGCEAAECPGYFRMAHHMPVHGVQRDAHGMVIAICG